MESMVKYNDKLEAISVTEARMIDKSISINVPFTEKCVVYKVETVIDDHDSSDPLSFLNTSI